MGYRAFSYLLQPTVRQASAFEALLDGQRELYNAALEERRGVWLWERRRVTRYEQYRTLTSLRTVRPDVLIWGVSVCRGTLTRLDEAFQGFYRRCAQGQRAGFPRFRGSRRWDSVQWRDVQGWRFHADAHRLYVQGVGHVKVRVHRPLRGVPKTCTLRRDGRRWRVTVFCAEVPPLPLPATGREVGVDRGVTAVTATSDGELVENPRFLSGAAGRIACAQRTLAATSSDSRPSRRKREAVGRAHRKVRNQRRDFLHKLSRRLVNSYDTIVIEDLRISNMTRRPAPRPNDEGGHDPNGAAAKAALNRSILDAGWGVLGRMLAYKAEDAGRQLIRVDPRHTSQRCADCGHVDGGNRVGAVFRCRSCGHTDHADINAARNILRAGLAQRKQFLRSDDRGGNFPCLPFTGP